MEEEVRKVVAGVSFSLTLGSQAGDLVPSSLYPPPTSPNNPVICVYYSGVADSQDKSSLFSRCSWVLSTGDRTLNSDEKTGPGKLN